MQKIILLYVTNDSGISNNAAVITRNRFIFEKIGDESTTCHTLGLDGEGDTNIILNHCKT